MKKIISVLLCVVMTASVLSAYAGAFSTDICVDSSYSVVYSDEILAAAAEKLSGYIGRVIGEAPAVSPQADGNCIILKNDSSVIENGYKIKADGSNILITGSTLQQTVRGAYAFLEKYCGISCYTSKLTVFKQNEIRVPADTDYSYVPYFEYTDTDWMSPCDTEYSLFNGLNSDEYRKIPAELGGTIDYISSFAHSLTNQFCSRDKYFEEHPEYFAFNGFGRTDKQLCLSNPEVVEIITQEVLDLLKKKHDPKADIQIISLTQNDNISYCRCDKCREIDRKCGSHAGTYVLLANAVAKTIREKGYDNVVIDTFAYRYTRTAPKGIELEPNVVIRLCSIEGCFSHALDDPSCKTNADFMHDLEEWSKICKRVYIWDYCTNYTAFVGLFPDFGVLQRNMQIFYEHNVKGVYEEGNYTMNVCDTEFGELRSYMISKLMQDPYLDFNAVRDEFINAYYGEGGKYVSEFLDIITENAGKKHLGIYMPMTSTLAMSPSQVRKCDELWEKAKSESTGTELENVIHSEMSWRYWKMKNLKSEFSNPVNFMAEKEKLTSDIHAAGVDRWTEATGAIVFFSKIGQALYFDLFPLVNFFIKLIYKAI